MSIRRVCGTTIRVGHTSYKQTQRRKYDAPAEITGVCGVCGDNPFYTTKGAVDSFGRLAEDRFTSLVCDMFKDDEVPEEMYIQLTSKQLKKLGGCPTCRQNITANNEAYDKLVGVPGKKRGWFEPHLVYDNNEKKLVRNRKGRYLVDGTKGAAHFVPVVGETDEKGRPLYTATFYGRVWCIKESRSKQHIRIKFRLFPRNDGAEMESSFQSDPDELIQTYREGDAWYLEFEGEPRRWFGCMIRFNTGTYCKRECKKCDQHSDSREFVKCGDCDEAKCNRHKLFVSWNTTGEDDHE